MKAAIALAPSQAEYRRLLSGALPAVIPTEAQNDEYLIEVTELLQRASFLSEAEREFLRLLTLLIQDFEQKNYAPPKASPLEAITFLMDQHGLKQSDLSDIFGAHSTTSEVLSGKRQLNKRHIHRLSKRFNVSPELFF